MNGGTYVALMMANPTLSPYWIIPTLSLWIRSTNVEIYKLQVVNYKHKCKIVQVTSGELEAQM